VSAGTELVGSSSKPLRLRNQLTMQACVAVSLEFEVRLLGSVGFTELQLNLRQCPLAVCCWLWLCLQT
jgi:hypothetical protein